MARTQHRGIGVWADEGGKANVSYFDPKSMFTAVNPEVGKGGQQMSDALSKIATKDYRKTIVYQRGDIHSER